MPKPSDFFVGVMEFFAILLPGALLAALLRRFAEGTLDLAGQPVGGAERWAAFLVAAYVLGHLLHAAGGLLLDPLYDCLYRGRWKLDKPFWVCVKDKWRGLKAGEFIVTYRPRQFPKRGRAGAQRYASLLRSAEELSGSDPKPDDLYHWAETYVRLNSDSGLSEIQQRSAESKFFRSFGLVLLVALVVSGVDHMWRVAIGAGLLSLFSLWRFFETRWKTTLLVYEYFVQLRQAG